MTRALLTRSCSRVLLVSSLENFSLLPSSREVPQARALPLILAGREGAERSFSGRAAFRGGCSRALGRGGDASSPKFCAGPELRLLAHPWPCWMQEGEIADGVVCLGVTGSQGWCWSARGKGCARCASTRSSLAQPCLRSCSSLGGFLGRTRGALCLPGLREGLVVAGGRWQSQLGEGC